MCAPALLRSCASVLLILVLIQNSGAEEKSLANLLREFDRNIIAEEYRAAAHVLLSAEEQYPGAPEILTRMQRFEKIVHLRSELDAPISFRYSEQYRAILERREELRRYFAPTDREVAASFLATAALFLGAEYVAGWVEAQENRGHTEQHQSSGGSKSSQTSNTSSQSSPGTISIRGTIYCDGFYYKNRAVDVYINEFGWTRLGGTVTDSEGRFSYNTKLHEGSSVSRFKISGVCGEAEIGTSRSVTDISIKLH